MMKLISLCLPAFPLFLISCSTKQLIATSGSSEDLTASGEVLITASTPRSLLAGMLPFPKKSTLSTLDTAVPVPTLKTQEVYEQKKFKPVGIDLVGPLQVSEYQGQTMLFAVNATKNPSVSLFRYGADQSLKWQRNICGKEALDGPNGIAVSRDGVIYVSNLKMGLGFKDRIVCVEELPTKKTRRNSIVSYDLRNPEKGWAVVARGFAAPNGLALSEDESQLLCASYLSKKVHVFERNGQQLSLLDVEHKLDFNPDNLKRLEDGSFSITGQRFLVPTALHFLVSSWIPAPGKFQIFRWDAKKFKESWSSSMLRSAPATTLIIGSKSFTGRVMASGVEVRDLPGD